jgi:hypothetical protein
MLDIASSSTLPKNKISVEYEKILARNTIKHNKRDE